MITFLLVIALILLFCLFGVGPVLLFLREPRGCSRVLLLPFAGLASGVLAFFALLPLNLTGRTTAVLETGLFAAIAAGALVKRRFTLEEWKLSVAPMCACLAALLIAGWPLFLSGFRDYMGYGNPDVPYFIAQLNYFSDHVVRLPDDAMGWYRGLIPTGFLGVFGVFYGFSAITTVPVSNLFAIFCAALAATVPASTFFLAEQGAGLSRRDSLILSFLSATSSVLALTFYLHSLGTLCVMVFVPTTLTLLLIFLETGGTAYAVMFALLFAGLHYNYPQGTGVIGAASFASVAYALVRRPAAWRRIGRLAITGAAVVLIPAAPYAVNGVQAILQISRASNLMVMDEIQATFAMTLTERGVPFAWGLSNLYAQPPAFLGSPKVSFAILFGLGLVLCVLVAGSMWTRLSRFPKTFAAALAGMLFVLAFYYSRGVAYGVFKLAAWLQVTALVAAIGFALEAARRLRHRIASVVVATLLVVMAGLNLANGVRLGGDSLGWFGGGMNSAPGLTLSEFVDLRRVPASSGTLVGVGDPVVRLWASPFLGSPEPSSEAMVFKDPRFVYLSGVGLLSEDSTPLEFLPNCPPSSPVVACGAVDSPGWLNWRKTGREIGGESPAGSWSNEVFTFRPGVDPNALVLGRGWYRAERIAQSSAGWQRQAFRWLRKRAEFFIVRPSPSPKRLHFIAVAGYGGASQERHIDVLLNGRVSETVVISGYREIYTQPVRIPGPLSQFELVVREDVQPLPRAGALWNRWVPGDARRLNVAISRLELIGTEESAGLPASATFETGAERWAVPTDGIYPDLWIGKDATLDLLLPKDAGEIHIRGFIPGVRTYTFPTQIAVEFDGEAVGTARIAAPGDFDVRVPFAASPQDRSVHVRLIPAMSFNAARLGIGADDRTLSLRLYYVGLETRPVKRQ